ncbi:hypothetical protein SAMN05421788_110179 [Filimonas lacunae]|uniref:Uncharacterized protein n=1 Tax=Filimonas lacunae TaxID=477680 RepID=A0A173MA67_9BACT|nr:hypothetical protein [Filimonas lacunae]BAV04443.1 hypothetical protein FLA_0434 [Filimonas lacunae]SIT31458.1 hypothetical protein SAMN05421788_110179 [Filimonas lacunae]
MQYPLPQSNKPYYVFSTEQFAKQLVNNGFLQVSKFNLLKWALDNHINKYINKHHNKPLSIAIKSEIPRNKKITTRLTFKYHEQQASLQLLHIKCQQGNRKLDIKPADFEQIDIPGLVNTFSQDILFVKQPDNYKPSVISFTDKLLQSQFITKDQVPTVKDALARHINSISETINRKKEFILKLTTDTAPKGTIYSEIKLKYDIQKDALYIMGIHCQAGNQVKNFLPPTSIPLPALSTVKQSLSWNNSRKNPKQQNLDTANHNTIPTSSYKRIVPEKKR